MGGAVETVPPFLNSMEQKLRVFRFTFMKPGSLTPGSNRTATRTVTHLAVLLVSTLTLAGCGGSGGGEGTGSTAPVAQADTYTVVEGSTTTLNLAANDNDADGDLDLGSIVIISDPSNGTYAVNANGSVDYIHDGSETPLTDNFTYTIDDLTGATSNTATVNLTITPFNDAPVAVTDNFTVAEGSTTTLNLAINDSDVDNALDLTSLVVSVPGNGSLIVNANGTVDYTHNGSEAPLADSFTYTIDDQSGAISNTATVNLTITPVNDAPIAVTNNFTVAEGSTTTLNLAANDSDADDGLDLTSIAVSVPGNGSLIVNANGTVDYTHNGSEAPLADSFTYTIDDQSGAISNTATVNLTITPVNDIPVAQNGTLTTDENTPKVGTLVAIDMDGPSLSYSIVSNGNGSKGTAVITNGATGAYTYTPNTGAIGSDTFSFHAIDGFSVSNTATITVTINDINFPPVAVADGFTVAEGSTTTLNLAMNDSDPDDGLDLASIVASAPTNGSLAVNANGTVDYTHDGSEAPLADSFTYTIKDVAGSTSNTVTVSLTITPVNDAPIAVADNFTVAEGSTTTLDLAVNDDDVDNALDLTSIIASLPVNGSLVINTDGTVDYTHDGRETTSDSFTYTIDDVTMPIAATSNTVTVSLTITPVNDPPVATGSCRTTPQAQTLNGTLGATDPDSTLTYLLNTDGSGGASITTSKGATVTLNTSTGDFSYQPLPGKGDMRGEDSFGYQVSDGAASDSATQTVIVDQKIMPLGDSITTGEEWIPGSGNYLTSTGTGDVIGYRRSLFDNLNGAGYTFDFVGSLTHGNNQFSDAQHEGHEGWTAFDIAFADSPNFGDAEVQAWLDSNPADIILLHVGTNNFAGTSAADIGNILDKIDAWAVTNNNPITVLLARIIDQYDYTAGAIVDVRTFNDNVASMVAGRSDVAINVSMVDQRGDGTTFLYPADLSEDSGLALHPNAGGYTKMANVWFTALETVLNKCP